MSIVTKKGDQGMTGLMYNHRVSKCHPRVQAAGAIDELNAVMGAARAESGGAELGEILKSIQKELITVMGEIATLPQDADRYAKDGYPLVTTVLTGRLENLVRELESQNISYHGWATPGQNRLSAALDVARTICRRAERTVCQLKDSDESVNPEILVYLNRLSDLLWLWARRSETSPGA
jgi:cob(I)alamin adenosyltransferase